MQGHHPVICPSVIQGVLGIVLQTELDTLVSEICGVGGRICRASVLVDDMVEGLVGCQEGSAFGNGQLLLVGGEGYGRYGVT